MEPTAPSHDPAQAEGLAAIRAFLDKYQLPNHKGVVDPIFFVEKLPYLAPSRFQHSYSGKGHPDYVYNFTILNPTATKNDVDMGFAIAVRRAAVQKQCGRVPLSEVDSIKLTDEGQVEVQSILKVCTSAASQKFWYGDDEGFQGSSASDATTAEEVTGSVASLSMTSDSQISATKTVSTDTTSTDITSTDTTSTDTTSTDITSTDTTSTDTASTDTASTEPAPTETASTEPDSNDNDNDNEPSMEDLIESTAIMMSAVVSSVGGMTDADMELLMQAWIVTVERNRLSGSEDEVRDFLVMTERNLRTIIGNILDEDDAEIVFESLAASLR